MYRLILQKTFVLTEVFPANVMLSVGVLPSLKF